MKKRFDFLSGKLPLLVIAALLISILAVTGASAASSGSCGDGVKWTLDDSGVLTISGSGKITSNPWNTSARRDSIKKVVINEGVTAICQKAFMYCNKIETISIPDSVTEIGAYALQNCSELANVALPKGLKRIEAYTFQFCGGLTSMNIPDGVTYIGMSAFYGCSKMQEVTIPNSVTEIASQAFQNCDSLASVTIPGSVKTFGDSVFVGSKGLKSVFIQYGVTKVASRIFQDCVSLENVTIPDSVTSIETYAFYNCAMSEITIPGSVTFIGSAAFNSCANLKNISIPASVREIICDTFTWCTSLTSFEVAESNPSYSSVDGVMFSKDKTRIICYPAGKAESNYSVPDSVVSIEQDAFAGNTLTSIQIPNSVTEIGDFAFMYSKNLTDITIPEPVTIIRDYVFSNCSCLTKVTFPSGLKTIGQSTFQKCTSLADLQLPKGLESFGAEAFRECTSLTNLTLNCDAWGQAFALCTGLESVTFLEGVKSISDGAFYGCTALKSLVIPDSLTTIDDEYGNPFEQCTSISSITVSARNKTAIDWFIRNGFEKALNIYDIPIADCTITEVSDQVYTGKAIEPKITVKYSKTKLTQGTDYTLSFADNKDVGKASVTVTGAGKYLGKKTGTFNINPKAVTLSSLKAGKGKMTVKWKAEKDIDGYEIEYSLKKDFSGSKKITVKNAKSTSSDIEKLEAKKTYYVRIRAYKEVKGKKYCSEWSKALSVTIEGDQKGSFSGSFKNQSVYLYDKCYINGSVKPSGGKKISKIIVKRSGSDTDDFSVAIKKATNKTVKLSSYKKSFLFDADKAPWNQAGSFKLEVWVEDETGNRGSKPVATFTMTVKKKAQPTSVTINPGDSFDTKISKIKKALPEANFWSWDGHGKNVKITYGSVSVEAPVVQKAQCDHENNKKNCVSISFDKNGKPSFKKGNMQCVGFARMLGWAVSGKNPVRKEKGIKIEIKTDEERTEQVDKLAPGDIILIQKTVNDKYGHTAFITSVEGDKITVAEVNMKESSFDSHHRCRIFWDRTYYKKNLKGDGKKERRLITVYKYDAYSK